MLTITKNLFFIGLFMSLISNTLYAEPINVNHIDTRVNLKTNDSLSTNHSAPAENSDNEVLEIPSQEDIDKQIETFQSDIETQSLAYTTPDTVKEKTQLDWRFPVKSQLTPGNITETTVNFPARVPPFFIIGDDDFSLAWLKNHIDYFSQHHIVGFITNIETADKLKVLEKQFELSLHPVSLDGLREPLPVSHYPFWYEAGKIRQ
jgi:integrating conjugative element protein (TIGR03765 family)